MKISRREFVRRVSILGGVGAAHVAMEALGLAPVPVSFAGPPSLPPESGKGVKIVILGAGMAGLAAGYELRKAGYDITILEARDRVCGELLIFHTNQQFATHRLREKRRKAIAEVIDVLSTNEQTQLSRLSEKL